jgi:phenylacetate-CoA ligase
VTDSPQPPSPPRHDDRPDEDFLDRESLAACQRRKLAAMLGELLATNNFYGRKLASVRFDARVDSLDRLPFTTRRELEDDQAAHPPYGTNLTYPLDRYCRFHQTSGSGGSPVRWLDTKDSWAWFQRCWRTIFAAARVGPGDRLMFPFSFGPFVGFWAAFESSVALGRLSLPAGGMSTTARLKMLLDNDVTVVCCTPTYALRMAEVAAEEKVDLPESKVRALIVAGEPGGSIPEVRGRIEATWGARVFDHSGMTEMGAATFECWERPGGLHLIESEFIGEVIDPATGQVVPDGEAGELVLTNLGRWGSPLIRYRTGDYVRMVRGDRPCACGRWYARLEGGILGRIDDMFIVRGNNVFPTAVEAVLRRFPEIAEFRLTVSNSADTALTRVMLEVEPGPGVTPDGLSPRVAQALQEALNFRADVTVVPAGSLPRFEMKAKRFVRAG